MKEFLNENKLWIKFAIIIPILVPIYLLFGDLVFGGITAIIQSIIKNLFNIESAKIFFIINIVLITIAAIIYLFSIIVLITKGLKKLIKW